MINKGYYLKSKTCCMTKFAFSGKQVQVEVANEKACGNIINTKLKRESKASVPHETEQIVKGSIL